LLVGSCFARTTVDLLAGDARFSTLVKLVTQANLVDTLNGGDFTIFAPTDAAFAKLPADLVTKVTSDNALLTKVLTYHVVSGVVRSSAAMNELVVNTVNGAGARFNIYPNMGKTVVTIQGNVISSFDMMASNGVVHVVDSVMMAPDGDIVTDVAKSKDHTMLLSLVKKAGLATALQGQNLTLFAPTDAAFAKLDNATVNAVMTDNALLTNVLMYHVVPATVYSAGVYDNEVGPTLLAGKNVTVRVDAMGVMINNAMVTMADIGTTNGVIHVIDQVLIPPTNPGPIVG